MSKHPPLDHILLNGFGLNADQVHRLRAAGCKVRDYAVPATEMETEWVKMPNGWQRWEILFPEGSFMLKCPRDYDKRRSVGHERGEIGIRGATTDWLFAWSEKEPRRMLRLVKADLL